MLPARESEEKDKMFLHFFAYQEGQEEEEEWEGKMKAIKRTVEEIKEKMENNTKKIINALTA